MESLPKEPSPEEIEAEIDQKLSELYEKYNDLVGLEGELAEDWYWIEQEARVGRDRRGALNSIREFLRRLEVIKEKREF